MQNSSPKVDVATLAPATYPENPDNEWCGGEEAVSGTSQYIRKTGGGLRYVAHA